MKKNILPPRIVKYTLKENGDFPNNPGLPVLIYKHVLSLPDFPFRSAHIIEKIFHLHNWKNSWRNGIYNYHHYHSNTHEVMGVYRGSAQVLLGGPGGIITSLEKGDVMILPAGTAHKRLDEKNFRCVGAYPNGQDYDMNYGHPGEKERTEKNIRAVELPSTDPVFGNEGPIRELWQYHTQLRKAHGTNDSTEKQRS